jgi:hypothetical protein
MRKGWLPLLLLVLGTLMASPQSARPAAPQTPASFEPTVPPFLSRPARSEPLQVAAFVDGKVVGTLFLYGHLEGRTQEFRVYITFGTFLEEK